MSQIYQPTDIVLAKVKGFPAWPAMIIPEEIVPANVSKGKTTRNNSWKAAEDEAEDEDNEDDYIIYSKLLKFRKYKDMQSNYCVKFFCDDSYIWLKPSDFQYLTKEECEKWLNNTKKKNKKLIPAYEMALKGKDGIDVWEFVEYGSNGKPGDEEYVEDYDEEEKEEEEEEEEESTSDVDEYKVKDSKSKKRKRQTRQRSKPQKKETVTKRGTRSTSKKVETKKSEPSPKKKKAPPKKKKPQLEKYHYEDDEDWAIVGLGPQDLTISGNNTLVSKLSQKKNMELHNDLKTDLQEKLSMVNKLLTDVSLKKEPHETSDDYELILDELDLCLSFKGSQDELVTVFISNNELMTNFRVLFNLKYEELQNLDVWDKFQRCYFEIYGLEFNPDQTKWSFEPQEITKSADHEETNNDGIKPEEVNGKDKL